ncbi:GGIII-like transmembrane region-containing protein [Amycolatopsis sp. NPDC051758]
MNTTTVLADTSMSDVMDLMFERYLIIGGVALLAILLLGVIVLMFKKKS